MCTGTQAEKATLPRTNVPTWMESQALDLVAKSGVYRNIQDVIRNAVFQLLWAAQEDPALGLEHYRVRAELEQEADMRAYIEEVEYHTQEAETLLERFQERPDKQRELAEKLTAVAESWSQEDRLKMMRINMQVIVGRVGPTNDCYVSGVGGRRRAAQLLLCERAAFVGGWPPGPGSRTGVR